MKDTGSTHTPEALSATEAKAGRTDAPAQTTTNQTEAGASGAQCMVPLTGHAEQANPETERLVAAWGWGGLGADGGERYGARGLIWERCVVVTAAQLCEYTREHGLHAVSS